MEEKRTELKYRLQEALNIREKKAADLVKDLNIPKSAVSQYLSGKSQNMDSERMYLICKYLNVSEPWMLGYDVPMERTIEKKIDVTTDIIIRMEKDKTFSEVVQMLYNLDSEKVKAFKNFLDNFSQQ